MLCKTLGVRFLIVVINKMDDPKSCMAVSLYIVPGITLSTRCSLRDASARWRGG